MNRGRTLILLPAFLFAFMSSDSVADQGRGGQGKSGRGGPAFCRSGAGHPVYGWEWCEDRGWRQSEIRSARRARHGRFGRRGRDGILDRSDGGRRGSVAFDQGYSDGYEKGLDDAGDRRDFDPTRHRWYRAADRGYEDESGSKASYKNVYRDGFRSGYEAGYKDRERSYRRARSGDRRDDDDDSTPTARRRWPWPF